MSLQNVEDTLHCRRFRKEIEIFVGKKKIYILNLLKIWIFSLLKTWVLKENIQS